MRRDARDRYLSGALDGAASLRPMFACRLINAAAAAFLRFLARRRASQG
jgi:hypothetical protein